ncbi:MAG TPA: DUF3341 domain-containing protein [Myxococcales bacterium]|jgi:hypothetical protein
MPSPETTTSAGSADKPFAIVACFEAPEPLLHALEELRDLGYRDFDAHTPFPVHGIERAMGLKDSKVPYLSLLGGLTGLVGGMALQIWTMGYDYPLNLSGKPFVAWQAYIPIGFETTVLLTAFGTFFGMWGLNKLPRFFHPVMQAEAFPKASDDRFLVSVESSDPRFDPERVRELFKAQGAATIEEVQP